MRIEDKKKTVTIFKKIKKVFVGIFITLFIFNNNENA